MKTKDNYLTFLTEIGNVVKNLNLHSDVKKELHQKLTIYRDSIENPDFIIPIIGKFSSGKSTLINNFLGESPLPVGTQPVTKLATEIRYTAQSPYAEVIALDSKGKENPSLTKKIRLDELANFASEASGQNIDDYSFIRLFLNNEKLKAIQPNVLVDMPGYGSNNAKHQKAIAIYISRGIFFIVLTPTPDGTVDNSILDEIKNIPEEKKLVFCLTKTDMRPESVITKVKDELMDLLDQELEYEDEIYLADKTSTDILPKILESIDREDAFSQLYVNELNGIKVDLHDTLEQNIRVIEDSDKKWAEARLANLEAQKKQMRQDQEREIRDLETNQFDGTNEIIDNVKETLRAHKSSLLNTLDINQTRFQDEIIRLTQDNVTKLTKEYLQRKSEQLTDMIANSMRSVLSSNSQDFSLDNETISRIQEDIKQKINKTLTINTPKQIVDNKTNDSISGLLIRLLGNLLSNNPVGKVLNFILPDILKGIFSGDSYEAEHQRRVQQEQMQAAKNSLFEQVVYDLGNELKTNLSKVLNNFKRELIEAITVEFNNKLNKQIKDIEQAEENKNNIKDIEAEIENLKQAQMALDELVTKYL